MSASPDTSGSKNAVQSIGSTVTYLQRYTLYSILGLASAEQDDDGGAAAQPLDDNQVANLEALMDEVGADRKKFLQHFRIDAIEDLPQPRLKGAIAMLEAKRK